MGALYSEVEQLQLLESSGIRFVGCMVDKSRLNIELDLC